jgi:hypothetical protein
MENKKVKEMRKLIQLMKNQKLTPLMFSLIDKLEYLLPSDYKEQNLHFLKHISKRGRSMLKELKITDFDLPKHKLWASYLENLYRGAHVIDGSEPIQRLVKAYTLKPFITFPNIIQLTDYFDFYALESFVVNTEEDYVKLANRVLSLVCYKLKKDGDNYRMVEDPLLKRILENKLKEEARNN